MFVGQGCERNQALLRIIFAVQQLHLPSEVEGFSSIASWSELVQCVVLRYQISVLSSVNVAAHALPLASRSVRNMIYVVLFGINHIDAYMQALHSLHTTQCIARVCKQR